MTRLSTLLAEVRACRHCEAALPLGARPILQVERAARILIAGQAPGRKAHERGIPFDDPSGDRLRTWLGVTRTEFYDPRHFAIVPLGFCFPGTTRAGDLPPRPECAPRWRARLLEQLPSLELSLVLGRYAIDWHVPDARGRPVGAAVEQWRSTWPALLVLPHPSPRNQRWLKTHPEFERDVVPRMQRRVREILDASP